ncbi:MAG: hypothetical protein JW891_09390 [Candidatus Lokiarchaeota archaeon]|nr:hypothetical protein [Candidatus Lokiarchaeota archaeon]
MGKIQYQYSAYDEDVIELEEGDFEALMKLEKNLGAKIPYDEEDSDVIKSTMTYGFRVTSERISHLRIFPIEEFDNKDKKVSTGNL